MVIDIFNRKISIQKNINFENYNIGTEFWNQTTQYLDKLELSNDYLYTKSGIGTYGTCKSSYHSNDITEGINLFGDFLLHLEPYFRSGIKEINSDYEFSLSKMKRSWIKQDFFGSESNTHAHTQGSKYVAVFYYQTDEQSANNVMISSHNYIRKFLHEIPEEDKYEIKVEPGMLLIHDFAFMHAVTKHNSLNPRLCFVFEFY